MATIRLNSRTLRAIGVIKETTQLTGTGIVDNAVSVYSTLLAADKQGAEIIIKWSNAEKTRVLLP